MAGVQARRWGQVMELGKLIGLHAELNRDRYEFFDAWYQKTAVK